MNIFKVISAHTAQPNTPETDKQEKVLHIVSVQYENGELGEIKVMAKCPLDAMTKVQKRDLY